MSTAGKVLTVLILLVMVGWIVMLSAVTQLNVNWHTRIAKQEADIVTFEARATAARVKTLAVVEQTRAEQASKDRDLRQLQEQVGAREAQQSMRTENLTRIQFQLAEYQIATQKAELNLTTRDAELAKARQDLAAKRVESAKRQDENVQLRDQLAKLQDDFKRLLTNNAKTVDKISGDRPVPQPTSDRRPAPAS